MLILCLLLVSLELFNAESYVATSTHEMARVLEGEDHLLRDLQIYITKLEKKLNNVRVLLSDAAKRKEEAKADPVAYIANPLNSFPLLRRMHADAPKLMTYLDNDVLEQNEQHIADYNLDVVSDMDFDAAAEGLLRIQDVYDLEVRDMALGRLSNVQYNTTLNALDCLALGRYQSKKGNEDEAINWLQMALEQYKKTPERVFELMHVNREMIQQELGEILIKRD